MNGCDRPQSFFLCTIIVSVVAVGFLLPQLVAASWFSVQTWCQTFPVLLGWLDHCYEAPLISDRYISTAPTPVNHATDYSTVITSGEPDISLFTPTAQVRGVATTTLSPIETGNRPLSNSYTVSSADSDLNTMWLWRQTGLLLQSNELWHHEINRLETLIDKQAERTSDSLSDYVKAKFDDIHVSELSGATLTLPVFAGPIGSNLALGNYHLSGDGDDEGLFVDANGRLGIGTTTPPELLSVVGGALYLDNFTPGTVTNRLYAQGGSLYWNGSSLTAGNASSSWDGNGTDVYRLTGNVGIGTTTPSSLLTVGPTAGSQFLVSATGTITDGLWNGDVIGTTYGGTGLSVYVTGDILYSSGAGVLARRAIGNTGDVLSVVGGVPTWVATSSLGISGGSAFGSYIDPTEMAVTDFGSFSCDSIECTLDSASVDISAHTNFSVGATGLALASDELVLSSGYEISLVASTTNWNNFYNTPSTRIVTGTGLSWAGNTLTVSTSSLGLSPLFTTSSQLAGLLSDETGTGATVFAQSPTLVTPNLGTPSTVDLTNASNLPIATGISGLGSGVSTTLAVMSSANLANAITDETGNAGSIVFSASPTFTGTVTAPLLRGGSGQGNQLVLRSSTNINPNANAAIVFNYGVSASLEAMRIPATTGFVGIGTSSPATTLDVWGNFQVGSSSVPTLYVNGGTNHVGIGTSTPSTALTVDGTILASNLLGGATNLTTDANGNIIRDASDARLKKNVVEIEDALDLVLQLRGVRYEWKDAERFGEQTEIGFIAQEVDTVLPEVVSKGGDYWSLNTKNMVAVVVEAIKELWQTVSGHEDRITELEVENAELRSRLDAVEETLQEVSVPVSSGGANDSATSNNDVDEDNQENDAFEATDEDTAVSTGDAVETSSDASLESAPSQSGDALSDGENTAE